MERSNLGENTQKKYIFNIKGITRPHQLSTKEQLKHSSFRREREEFAQFQFPKQMSENYLEQLTTEISDQENLAERTELQIKHMIKLMLQKRMNIHQFLDQIPFFPSEESKVIEIDRSIYNCSHKLFEIGKLQEVNYDKLRYYRDLNIGALFILKLEILKCYSNFNKNLVILDGYIRDHLDIVNANSTLPNEAFSPLPDYNLDFSYFGEK